MRVQNANNELPGTTRRRYVLALAGVFLYVVLDAIAQLLPPHYSPISQAESDLAVGPFGFVMTVNFLNRGGLSIAFILGLVGSARLAGGETRSRMRNGLAIFGVWSVGALLLAIFPTDVPATPVSWHGAIHLVVAILAFLGGAFGALLISRNMKGSVELEGARRFAVPLAVLAVVLCLVDLLTPFVAPHFSSHFGGLLERLFLGSVLLWIAAVSAFMIRPRTEEEKKNDAPVSSAQPASSRDRALQLIALCS